MSEEQKHNLNEIFELMDVDPGKITVTGVQLTTWGRELLFDCRYQDEDGEKNGPFQLLFEECRSVQWDVHGEPDEQDKVADVMGIILGEDKYEETAIIYTDLFEITASYGRFTLIKDW